MSRLSHPSSLLFLMLAAGCLLLTSPENTISADAQDDEEIRDERQDLDEDAEAIERHLAEIMEAIEQAEDQGDFELARELRLEGEQLLDVLESIERSRIEDEGERFELEEFEIHLRELELHRMELEIDRLHREMNAAQQESAIRQSHLAESRAASAAYAVKLAIEHLGEEGAIDFLTNALDQTENEVTRRIILHELARLSFYVDRPYDAQEILLELIVGE